MQLCVICCCGLYMDLASLNCFVLYVMYIEKTHNDVVEYVDHVNQSNQRKMVNCLILFSFRYIFWIIDLQFFLYCDFLWALITINLYFGLLITTIYFIKSKSNSEPLKKFDCKAIKVFHHLPPPLLSVPLIGYIDFGTTWFCVCLVTDLSILFSL